jgi:hypothetical protein
MTHAGRDFGQRVQQTAGGFAMDQHDIADLGVRGQGLGDSAWQDRLVFRCLNGDAGAPQPAGDLDDPTAIGAVHQHQKAAVTRHQSLDRGLHRERAAALNRHGDVRPLDPGQRRKTGTNTLAQRDKIGFAGSPVAAKRRPGLIGRRQRTRCEQKRRHGCVFTLT